MLASVLIVILDGGVLEVILVGAAAFGALAAATAAFSIHVPLPGAAPPAHPVLFFNPKSGGGKAERFKLADEARARGIEPVELTPGTDLEQLVRDAVAAAPTGWRWPAATARRRSSPRSRRSSTCRMHASPPGPGTISRSTLASIATTSSERSTHSSMGASGVSISPRSTAGYSSTTSPSGCTRRRSRRRVIATPSCGRSSTPCPTRSGPRARASTCNGPGRAAAAFVGAAILVSNNRYRLGSAVGSGTRPHIDDGLLGSRSPPGPPGPARTAPETMA